MLGGYRFSQTLERFKILILGQELSVKYGYRTNSKSEI